MHIDQQVMKFLRRKENLPLALEISRYGARLQKELDVEFWERIKERVHPGSLLPGDWDVQQISWPRYQGWGFIEKAFAAKPQALGFAVEMYHGEAQDDVYVGAWWKLPVPLKDKNYSSGPLAKLRQEMLDAGLESWPPEWVCGKYVRQYTNPDGFYVEYADKPKRLVDAVIEAFGALARQHLDSVRAVNRAL